MYTLTHVVVWAIAFTQLLSTNPYVIIIALDFFRAFDTVVFSVTWSAAEFVYLTDWQMFRIMDLSNPQQQV